MESPQNIKKRLKSVNNINQITKAMELVSATWVKTLDIGAGFAILKMFNHTAFLRLFGRRQFFYGK